MPKHVESLVRAFKLCVLSDDLASSMSQEKWVAEAGLAWLGDFLRDKTLSARRRFRDARVRLALHLAPPAAINFDPTSADVRWKVVDSHLRGTGLDKSEREQVSRLVADVLDRWDASRRDCSRYLDALLAKQDSRCASCGYKLRMDAVGRPVDELKPYHVDWDLYTSPAVDHVDAVSRIGTNSVHNLQALCWLCNFGKNVDDGVHVSTEIKWAGTKISDVPVKHRAAMLYEVLSRDNGVCRRTGMTRFNDELTIALIDPMGPYVMTNLEAVSTRVVCEVFSRTL